MATSSPKQGYRKSSLLTKEENEKVRGMLGEGCQGLATSVIQLFMTEPPLHTEWTKKDAGILCLVRDSVRKSYFLRLYCLKRQCLVWEMELYRNMEYNAPKPFLHVFEGQDCVFALNFASESEAEQTYNIINNKLEKSKQKNAAAKVPPDMAKPSTSKDEQEAAAAPATGPEVVKDAEVERTQEEDATAPEADKAEGEESAAVDASTEKTESTEATGPESEPSSDANVEEPASAETPQDDVVTSEVRVIVAPAASEDLTAGEPVSEPNLDDRKTPEGGTEQESSDTSVPTDSEAIITKQHSAFIDHPVSSLA